jgi:hypothetical protein
MNTHVVSALALERMVTAVEKVRDRLRRACQALEEADVKYAVAGGNAVAAWVATVDEAAVRNTRDVDIVVRRADLDRVTAALARAGFQPHPRDCEKFLDGNNGLARAAVKLIFAGEKIRSEYGYEAPDVDDATKTASGRVVKFEPLVRMKLTSFRTIDRVHIRDLIDVELVDATWVSRLPPDLAGRLQQILDTPEG